MRKNDTSGNSPHSSKKRKPSERLRHEPMPDSDTSGQHDPKSGSKSKQGDNQKQGNNQQQQRTNQQQDPKQNRKTDSNSAADSDKVKKSKLRFEKSADNLENARNKLAKKKPAKPQGVVKTLTHAAQVEVWARVHNKIHQHEHENVGVEGAHRTELTAERAIGYTSNKIKQRIRNAPARKVAKLEKRHIKRSADYHFRKMAQENPSLKKNAFKRFWHKRRIQRKFRNQARHTAAAAQKAEKSFRFFVVRFFSRIAMIVKRHPLISIIAILLLIVVFILQSCVSSAVTVISGSGGGIAASTYLSEDSDMLAAHSAYVAMEEKLQDYLDNFESHNPGFDEYHFDLDEIWHDPYALISILSALHIGAWTFDEVQGTLNMLFERQYILTETVTVEVRSRVETYTTIDPVTNEVIVTEYVVYYNYYIIHVTLENMILSRLPVYIMSYEAMSRYALLMATLGNRPDLFPNDLFPNASFSRDYLRFPIPPEYLQDHIFAAMIAEAEKFLGFPYVWGGSSPATSFDCSGFVSWVVNNTFWNFGRLTARGLYAVATPVSPQNARPGDLIFFHSTFRTPTPGISHVGIYVGSNMMIHAGNPISYVPINTPYWERHFYGFARLPHP